MTEIQGPLSVLHETEVQSLDPGGRRVSAIVAGWNKLSSTETSLDIGRTRGEDRLIARRNVSTCLRKEKKWELCRVHT